MYVHKTDGPANDADRLDLAAFSCPCRDGYRLVLSLLPSCVAFGALTPTSSSCPMLPSRRSAFNAKRWAFALRTEFCCAVGKREPHNRWLVDIAVSRRRRQPHRRPGTRTVPASRQLQRYFDGCPRTWRERRIDRELRLARRQRRTYSSSRSIPHIFLPWENPWEPGQSLSVYFSGLLFISSRSKPSLCEPARTAPSRVPTNPVNRPRSAS